MLHQSAHLKLLCFIEPASVASQKQHAFKQQMMLEPLVLVLLYSSTSIPLQSTLP
jgi:hypothetical protein